MQRNANMLKILKKVRFCRFYGFLCKKIVSCLSSEKMFVSRGNFALGCMLDIYKDCFILFMVQKNVASESKITLSLAIINYQRRSK